MVNRIPAIDDYLKMPVDPMRNKGGSRSALKQGLDQKYPLVTVITVVRNRKDTLAQTIKSIASQSYPNIEYIVIDGLSTDGTVGIIKQFDNKIDNWISEPDSGTADAFNKGLSLAKGDLVFWLASDDWIDPDYIESAIKVLLDGGVDFVFGDISIYKEGDPVRILKGSKNYAKLLMSGYPRFTFPTMIIKRKCFQDFGLIDTSYKFFNDYELVLRFHLNGASGLYSDSLMIHKRVGGVGESLSVQSVSELLRLLKQYRLPKTKAMVNCLYYLMRGSFGSLVRRILPQNIHNKLKYSYGRAK